MALYDVKPKSWMLEPDKFEILVGNSSRHILVQETFIICKYQEKQYEVLH